MISIFTVYSDICKKSAPAHWQIRRFKDIITSSRSGIWGDEEKGDANDIVCYRVADFDYSNLCLKFDNIHIAMYCRNKLMRNCCLKAIYC